MPATSRTIYRTRRGETTARTGPRVFSVVMRSSMRPQITRGTAVPRPSG